MDSGNNIRFFVIGAAKSGTTTLYEFLKRHPDVFLPNVKEPHFYAKVRSERKSDYSKADKNKTYHTKVIQSQEDYQELYEGSETFHAVGDCSPSYLWDKDAAKRIYTDFPRAKIVAILRNPVDRAYSHYLMDVREGLQAEKDFLKALHKDASTLPKVWGGKSHLYAELGMYYEQLKRYAHFQPDQLKVFVYEHFFANLEASYKELCEFLEIPATSPEQNKNQKKKNEYAAPKNKWAAKLLQWNQKTQFLRRLFPEKMRKGLKQSLMSKSASKPPMGEEAKTYLSNRYSDEINKLESAFNLDLSIWKENLRNE